jgi:peroxiredoxin
MSAGADGKILAKVDEIAPDFAATNVDGETVRLTDYLGKTVILDFWATWCIPCVRTMPSIEAARRSWQDLDVVVLAVNIEDREKAKAFIEEKGYEFSTVLDPDKEIMALFGVDALPTTFLIDKFGVVRERSDGQKSWLGMNYLMAKERFRRWTDWRADQGRLGFQRRRKNLPPALDVTVRSTDLGEPRATVELASID